MPPLKQQQSGKIAMSPSQVAELGSEFENMYNGLSAAERARLSQALLDHKGTMTAGREQAMQEIHRIAGGG